MAVLQQPVGNIPVPNSLTTTVTLSEFISYALTVYVRTTNWQLHLAHLPVLPLEGYETFTWLEVIDVAKKVPASFLNNTLGNMYENVNYLMGIYGGGGGGSSGVNYSAEIIVLQAVAAKIPTYFNTFLPALRSPIDLYGIFLSFL
jgi:hypothetical protein